MPPLRGLGSAVKRVDWARYDRCPVCFRSWDCRTLRRAGRRYHMGYLTETSAGKVWRRWSYIGYPTGWGDRELKRPHRGRRRKVGGK